MEGLALTALDIALLLVDPRSLADLITVRQLWLHHLLGPIIDHVVLLIGILEKLLDFLVSFVDGNALGLVEDHARKIGWTAELWRVQLRLLSLHYRIRREL